MKLTFLLLGATPARLFNAPWVAPGHDVPREAVVRAGKRRIAGVEWKGEGYD